MRYLFEVLVPVAVSISSVGDDDLDVALLSPSLWNTLFDLTESAAERAAIHITSQSLYSAVESSRLRRSFSCWCRLDKRVRGDVYCS